MKRGRSGPIGSRMTIATLAAALLFGAAAQAQTTRTGEIGRAHV